jgi:hypothetical protein
VGWAGFKGTKLVLIELTQRHFNHARWVVKTTNKTRATKLKNEQNHKNMKTKITVMAAIPALLLTVVGNAHEPAICIRETT